MTHNEPDLGSVLAYCILAKPEDVARVERAARNRMTAVHGWTGWRVFAVDIQDESDDLVRMNVHCEPVGAAYHEAVVYDFLTDHQGKRRSDRLDAFLRACGVKDRVDDTREIAGRYFATRNRGRIAADFGPLANAIG